MMETTKKSYPSIRLFKSDLLERFSHVHPMTPLLLWGPMVLGFYYWTWFELKLGALGFILVLGGVLIWSLTEYVLHRTLFHLEPSNKLKHAIQFYTHGMHHQDPNDPTRLVFPPVPAIGVALLFGTLFYLGFGNVWWAPLFAGFGTGYLMYDYIHFATHHFRMRFPGGRFLKEYHMKHHFVDHHSRYGVSSPLWDYVFRTTRPASELNSKKKER